MDCGIYGTSARLAQWYAQGKISKSEAFIHESYIGSRFTARVEETTHCGPFEAIIPSIEGWAKIYGQNIINIDPEDDPYAYGFQVI